MVVAKGGASTLLNGAKTFVTRYSSCHVAMAIKRFPPLTTTAIMSFRVGCLLEKLARASIPVRMFYVAHVLSSYPIRGPLPHPASPLSRGPTQRCHGLQIYMGCRGRHRLQTAPAVELGRPCFRHARPTPSEPGPCCEESAQGDVYHCAVS